MKLPSRLSGFIKKHSLELFLFLSSLVLRIGYAISIFDPVVFNKWMPEGFDRRARFLVEGKSVYFPTAWASYHVIISPIYKLIQWLGLFTKRLEVMIIISSTLGAWSIVQFYKIAQKLFPKLKFNNFFSTLPLALYYPLIYFNSLLISENLFVPLILWAFSIFVDLQKDYKKKGILLGFILGIATVIRPSIMSFIPFLFIWLYFIWRKDFKEFIKRFFVDFIISFGIVLLVVSAVNYFSDRHRVFTFTGNGGVNFTLNWCQPRRIEYRTSAGDNFWFSPPNFHGKDKSTDINTDIPFTNQGYYYSLGFNCLKDHPERLVSNLVNIKNMFDSELYPDIISTPQHKSLILISKIILIPFVIGYLAFPFINKKQRQIWFLSLLIFISQFVIVYLMNPGEERYLSPFVFLFFLFGGNVIARGALEFWKKVNSKFKFKKKMKTTLKLLDPKGKSTKQIMLTWLAIAIPLVIILFLISFFASRNSHRERIYVNNLDSYNSNYNFENNLPEIDDTDKQFLINLSYAAVERHFGHSSSEIDIANFPQEYEGISNVVFIGFRVDGRKKGSWSAASNNLAESVVKATENTLEDTRYDGAITLADLEKLEIEVFILGKEKPLDNLYEPGIHGLRIIKDDKQAIFYNSVAIENNWARDESLRRLCLKAGLTANCANEANTQLYYFSTVHFASKTFSDGVITFYRSNVIDPNFQISKERIVEAKELAEDWIVSNLKEEGYFNYQYLTSQHLYSNQNGMVRQLMTTRLLSEMASEDSELLELHKKNMDYVFSNWYREEGDKSYIIFNNNAEIGEASMALRSIIVSPLYDEYKTKADKLAQGLISMIKDSGEFELSYLREIPDSEQKQFSLSFYSGEAILALIDYYTKTQDIKYLDAAKKAQDYYLRKYVDEISINYSPSYVPWHSQTLNKLFKITNDSKYSDALFKLNDELIKIQNLNGAPYFDYLGRFYNSKITNYGKYSAVDAVSTEGIAYAYEIAKILGDQNHMEKYEESILKGAENLIKLQFAGENMYYIFSEDIEKVEGGIRGSVEDNSLRIDSTQHTVDAFRKILQVYFE